MAGIPQQKSNGRLIAVMNTETADLPREIWKGIPDFDCYQVSNYGRIKSLARYTEDINGVQYFRQEKILKLTIVKQSIKAPRFSIRTVLMKDGVRYAFIVPRLVYYVFVEKFDIYDQTLVVTRKNEDYLDCHYKNLVLRTVSENVLEDYSKGRKSGFDNRRLNVNQYSSNGTFLCAYKSISDASRATGVSVSGIRTAIQMNHYLIKQSYWRLGRKYKRINITSLEVERKKSQDQFKLAVQKYTLDGIALEKYNSVREAARVNECDSSHLAKACKDFKRICKGFRWRYYDTTETPFFRNMNSRPSLKKGVKGVQKVSMDGQVLESFDSIISAATALKVNSSAIAKACKVPHLTCKGYHWRFS